LQITPELLRSTPNIEESAPKYALFTLFVDASFDEATGAAGWGAWGISPTVRGVELSGQIKNNQITNSSQAEFVGICEALLEISLRGMLVGVNAIVLQCDNISALRQVQLTVANVKRAKNTGTGKEIYATGSVWSSSNRILGEKVSKALDGMPIWLRHVKGHESGADGRSLVNEKCDRLAKREMRKRKKELETGTEDLK
jgi:ribonuclease HI